MLYVRFPLSLRNVEDLLHEHGSEISYETVRFWWNRFGQMFAAETGRNMNAYTSKRYAARQRARNYSFANVADKFYNPAKRT
jgi:transposase-like protein